MPPLYPRTSSPSSKSVNLNKGHSHGTVCQIVYAWFPLDRNRRLRKRWRTSGGLTFKPGFHYTANATTTTQKQSDYKVEQSSFTLIALFWLEIGRCRGRNWLNGNQALCSFYHESLRTWIKTIVNTFAISNHTALILGVDALRSYLKLIREYEFHSLPNKKVSGAKDHGKNYIRVRLPLVRHLLRNRLLDREIVRSKPVLAHCTKVCKNLSPKSLAYQAFCSLTHYNLMETGSFLIRKLNQPTCCLMLQYKGKNTLKSPFNSSFK